MNTCIRCPSVLLEIDAKMQERKEMYLLLNGELDSYALRMGLRPDEARIDKADLVETLEFLEADGKELA